MNKLISSIKKSEILRFILVGGVATVIHYLIYLVIHGIGVPYNIAYTVGYITSFGFNFFASTYFTFSTEPSKQKGIRFALSHLINYFLQVSVLNILIWMGCNNNIAPIIVFTICVPTNFIFVRLALKYDIRGNK